MASDRLPDLLSGIRYENGLDVEGFSGMLKDPSFCYKFYWLEAVVNLISRGVRETTFNDLIDEMIVNAWYSVLEYHVHLSAFVMGEVRDGLERAVLRLREVSSLPANASPVEIRNAIREHRSEVREYKKQLTNMVPYRALSGFFRGRDMPDWSSNRKMVGYIDRVNKTVKLPYVLTDDTGLDRKVIFDRDWMRFIQDNTVTILGWIQFEKVRWLQNNNPEVPALVYKLKPVDEKARKLEPVRKLWNAVIDMGPVRDIYTGDKLEKGRYDVDHFIPWSFVISDELWNLMPMEPSLNASKNNRLPKWDPFFERFARNQFGMYTLINEKESIRGLFEKCYRDNLHSIWAGKELYIPGNSETVFTAILEKNMRPVYDSAIIQVYELWNR